MKISRIYKLEKPEKDQLKTVEIEVALEKVRGGYSFSTEKQAVKIKSLEDPDLQKIAEKLGLSGEDAVKFINKLVFLYKVSPKQQIQLPEIRSTSYNERNCVGIGLADLYLFVEKSRTWKLQLFDSQLSVIGERHTCWLTAPFKVKKVEDLLKNAVLKEGLKLRFKARLVPLIVASIIEAIETEGEEHWTIAKPESPKETTTQIVRAELPTSEAVSDVFAYSGDRKFNGRIQIKSLGFPKSRFLNLNYECRHNRDNCDRCSFNGFKMSFEENFDASAFATYFDTNNPKAAFRVLCEKGLIEGCEQISAKGDKETAITQAIVSDRAGNEAKSWFVHSDTCDLRRGPNWIFSEGWLCRGKYGRIGVLVLEFQSESEVMQPDDKTVETSKEYLRSITTEDEPTVWKVSRVMRKKCNLKGKESTQGFVADLLTIGASIWIKTPEGPSQIAMTSAELGETTTAKSQREREIIDWLKAGKYESGRKTSAGLAAGAEKIEGMGWVMRKGLLPSADLSFLILDNMYPHALNEFIESRRNGIIMLSTIKSCELWARARLKLLSNPVLPFDQHLHKCVALKVYDSKFIARFTFVNFTYGVNPEVRYNPAVESISEDEQSLLNAVWNVLRWNLSQEITYTVPLELWPKIMGLSKKLELIFGNEDIPLFLRANPHKIAALTYCFALFEGTDSTERHVQQAYEWLSECGRDIELDEFTAQWKEEHGLSDEEYEAIANTITVEMAEAMRESGGDLEENVIAGFLNYVARHGEAQMEEVAASLNVGNRAVKSRARKLKGLGLIRSSKKGYFFTAKGVQFYKRWLKEHSYGELNAPDAPNSKRHTPVPPEKMHKKLHNFPRKQGVTPRNGFNGCIGFTIDFMFQVKSWCRANQDERSEISLLELADFITAELKQDPKRVIKKAYDDGILMPIPNVGKAVVI